MFQRVRHCANNSQYLLFNKIVLFNKVNKSDALIPSSSEN